MKKMVQKAVDGIENAGALMLVVANGRSVRSLRRKTGDVNIASMVALTVVVVGAIIGAASFFNTGVQNVVTGLFVKLMEWAGLN